MESKKQALEPLQGTTLKVYRFIHRQGHPVGVHEIQKTLRMASPSTAHYHLEKLLASGLIREEGGGYVVDKVFLDNYIRIRRTAIPLQAALAAFFATSLIILVIVVRPDTLTSGYLLGVAVTIIALIATTFRSIRDSRLEV
jgi:DNA-binding transcriptional ArsR family regulator